MNNEHQNSEQETPQDAQLSQLLQAHLPVASPSSALQERVASMTSQIAPTQAIAHQGVPRFRFRTWRLALSMATIALAIMVGSIIWPRVLARQALARVEAALTRVSSAHFKLYRIEGGKRIKERETWFENGKLRDVAPEQKFVFLYNKGTSWDYDQKTNTVTVNKHENRAFSRDLCNLSGFTLSRWTQNFGNRGSKTTVTLQGTTVQNGKTLKRVLLENTDDYETTKIVLLVDSGTDLPVSADKRVRNCYSKEGYWQMIFAYNRPLAPELFKPNFGPSVKFVIARTPTTSPHSNSKQK